MRATGLYLTMFSFAVVLMLGCAPAERGDETMPGDERPGAEPGVPPATPEPAAPRTPDPQAQTGMGQEQTVSGELTKVDMDAQTFTVSENGTEHVFSFSDMTEVEGAAGTQGLAGREGSQVTVHYTEELDTKRATRIQLQG